MAYAQLTLWHVSEALTQHVRTFLALRAVSKLQKRAIPQSLRWLVDETPFGVSAVPHSTRSIIITMPPT